MNQSAFERRIVRGMKYCSTCCCESWSQILLRDSTACHRQLRIPAARLGMYVYLVADEWLLNGGQILKRREEHVPILWSPDVLDKVAQLISESSEHFVFVLYRFCTFVSAHVQPSWLCLYRAPSRKGISSSLVRSGPNARAMVDSLRMAFNRKRTSSCWSKCQPVPYCSCQAEEHYRHTLSSSMRTAMG